MWETWVWSLGWEDPLEGERLPTPVFWPGEFRGLYSPWGHKESDTTKQFSLSFRKLTWYWKYESYWWGNQTVACQVPLSMGFPGQEILEWVAISFSRGSSRPMNWTQVSSITGRFFTNWARQEQHKLTILKKRKLKKTLTSCLFPRQQFLLCAKSYLNMSGISNSKLKFNVQKQVNSSWIHGAHTGLCVYILIYTHVYSHTHTHLEFLLVSELSVY